MFKKIGYSPSPITKLSKDAVLADPIIVERMTKLAHEIKSIAPKSDDFLYFSIIFLKSAESALIDEAGSLKKVGHEKAWGYFDEGWKWHGNVKPHKNNNGDIFPEIELKKAANKWIGMPLCKDHESSSVDGIRGIILDTHYDDKLKQVVGLCALDRVNYADLARKVETGIVRYGSMGTAVETSVCSECQNFAKTANEYCNHVKGRTAWGEVNVGLKPIEYSLVVQPAEPGAVLLRCFASLQTYKKEFMNYGVDNFDEMLGKLSLDQAQHLNTIVKTACGEDGCSPSERKRIITSFLKNNSLIPAPVGSQSVSEEQNMTSSWSDSLHSPGEFMPTNADGVKGYTGTDGSKGVVAAGVENSADRGNPQLGDSVLDKNIPDVSIINQASLKKEAKQNKSLISTIMEDIMTESELKKRAELRRKLAYHQGGSDGVEPTGYKSKPFSHNEDKHMKQTKTMGSKDGMFPGDEQKKEKLSRAELEDRQMRRLAYFQGGSEKAVEPAGFKSKPYSHNEDKHMKQTKTMGGKETLFPGDEKVKQTLKRAAYEGPALSTKLSWPVTPSGQINKSAALFEVYAGDRKVIAATGHEIFGGEVSQNWNWLTSKEYGQEVCKQIRTSGLNHVAMLLKGAQAVDPAVPVPPPAGEAPAAAPEAAPPMPPMPEMPEMGAEGEEESGGDKSPKDQVEESLTVMESEIDKVKDALKDLSGGEPVNVNVNVGDEGVEKEESPLKLSSNIASQLKTALAEMNESADELAMIAETYEGAGRLSAENRRELDKIASESLREASSLIGSSKTLTKMAKVVSSSLTKVAKVAYAEDYAMTHDAEDDGHSYMSHMAEDETMEHHAEDDGSDHMSHMAEDDSDDGANDLISKALDLRRARREQLVVEAAKKSKKMDEKMEKMRAAKKDEKKSDSKAAKKSKEEEEEEVKPAKSTKKAEDSSGAISKSAALRDMVNDAFQTKKAEDEKDSYKIKLRRAYDVAIEMQKKGLLPISKTALDKQVDDIMDFDDKAFEAFKRSVASARPVESVKVARDLGGLNVGVESTSEQPQTKTTAELLSMLWG
jgi:hypothetical protein